MTDLPPVPLPYNPNALLRKVTEATHETVEDADDRLAQKRLAHRLIKQVRDLRMGEGDELVKTGYNLAIGEFVTILEEHI